MGARILGGAPAAYLGQAATRCRIPKNVNPGFTYVQTRTAHRAVQALTTLQLVFPNLYVLDATAPNGTLFVEQGAGYATVTAAVEYPAGTMTRVTWLGGPSVAVPPAALSAPSDAIAVAIPAGAQFWVRCLYVNGSGIVFCDDSSPGVPITSNALYGDAMEAGTGTPTDKTMSGTIANSYDGLGYGASAILSPTTRPSVLLIGDSRDYGIGDQIGYAGSPPDMGQLARALGQAPVAYIDCGCSGDQTANFLLNASQARQLLGRFVSHVEIDLGINDVTNGVALSDLQLRLREIASLFSNRKILTSTLAPGGVTSTNGFINAAGQTANAHDSVRQAFNTWLRTVPAPFSAVWDISAVLEDPLNPGKWRSPGYTADGTHATPSAYQTLAASGAVNIAQIVR